ncbi:hypothetical protein FQN57_000850, partial [Myotisia sp. PD_48]
MDSRYLSASELSGISNREPLPATPEGVDLQTPRLEAETPPETLMLQPLSTSAHPNFPNLLANHQPCKHICTTNVLRRSPVVESIAEGFFPIAVKAGDAVMAEQMFQHTKINPTTDEVTHYTPLQVACLNGFLDLGESYFKPEPKLTRGDFLCGINSTDVVKALLQAGANVNPATDYSPLAIAATRGNVAMVSLLLAAGAEVNPKSGRPPLVSALASNTTDSESITSIVSCLLEAGADAQWMSVHSSDTSSRSSGEVDDFLSSLEGRIMPEIAVERESSFELVRLLITHGAQVSDQLMKVASQSDQSVEYDPPLFLGPKRVSLLFQHAHIRAAGTGDPDIIRTFLNTGALSLLRCYGEIIELVDTGVVDDILNEPCLEIVLDFAITTNQKEKVAAPLQFGVQAN